MKKHKLEVSALIILLGVLCYAFYDCNIKGSEQKIALSSELLSYKNITNKHDITTEMLALPTEELLKAQEETKEEEKEEETIEEEVTEEVFSEPEPEPQPEPVYVAPSYNASVGQAAVDYALQFVGNPYVYGGNSLTNGTDCSGFTKLVYANFGIDLHRVAAEQIYDGYAVSLDDIQPGDLVLSGYNGSICHSSMYIGNGQLVHALNENVGIVVTDLYIMPIISVRRVAN